VNPDELREYADEFDGLGHRRYIRAAADAWEALERERWDDFAKDDPQSWPHYVHEYVRDRMGADIKWRDAMLEYFDAECRSLRKQLNAKLGQHYAEVCRLTKRIENERQARERAEKMPLKCPVCDGCGHRLMNVDVTSTNLSVVPCAACKATGIVWRGGAALAGEE